MILEKDLLGYTLIWNEGHISIKDYDFEQEEIAHTLSDSLLPFNFVLINEISKELQNSKKEVFLKIIEQYSTQFSQMPKAREKVRDLALVYWRRYDQEITFPRNYVLGKSLQKWFFRAIHDEEYFTYAGICLYMASLPSTPASILSLMVAKNPGDLELIYSIARNKNTPQETLFLILEEPDYRRSFSHKVGLAALRNWKGFFPDSLAGEILDYHMDWDTLGYELALAEMEIGEKTQLHLATSEHEKVRKIFAKNKFITPQAKALLEREFLEVEL